jgi:radical SAM protein with 4Fe4S-binding SPASM domain
MENKEILEENLGNEKKVTLYADYSVSPLPKVIRIEPAGLCNLRCIHCPNKDTEPASKGIMSTETFTKIIEELKTLPALPVIVLYHGGEPLLNRSFFDMVRQLRDIGAEYIKTVSNGMLLNDEKITQLIESGIDSIEFSLDGMSPEENNRIRQGGNYDIVVKNIKKLIKKKEELGADKPELFITNCQIPTVEDLKKHSEVQIPPFLLEEFKEEKGKIDFKSTYMLVWSGFDLGDDYQLLGNEHTESQETKNYCEHTAEMMSIRWNGDVVPCCYDITSAYIIGNIVQHSLSEIWNNQRYRALRKTINQRKFIPMCNSCNVVKPQLHVVKKEE